MTWWLISRLSEEVNETLKAQSPEPKDQSPTSDCRARDRRAHRDRERGCLRPGVISAFVERGEGAAELADLRWVVQTAPLLAADADQPSKRRSAQARLGL